MNALGRYVLALALSCAWHAMWLPSSHAQQPEGRAQGEQAADLTPGQIQRLFDAMLLADAEQSLQLTDKQFPEFLNRLKALQETRRSNQQQRVKLMGELARLTNPRGARGDAAVIKERMAALLDLESQSAAELKSAYARIDEVLESWQQARFRILEEQIERRKIELLMRARANRQQLRRQNQDH